MDILLIDPPYRSLKGMPTDKGYNVGLTSLAAYLRQQGMNTAVLMGDLLMELDPANMWLGNDHQRNAAGQRLYEKIVGNPNHPIWKKMADVVREKKPRAVGVSYLTPQKCVVERIAGVVKAVDPGTRVIAGSAHPSFCPEEVMQNPDIDFVIRGEGEIPLHRLLLELNREHPELYKLPALNYRDDQGRVRTNHPTERIADLDELPFPARDLVLDCNYNRYRAHHVATVRGCPYSCAFCSDRRLWGGRVRRRSVENVIEELRFLKDNYRVDYVLFVDGTFTYDRRWLKNFCNAMTEQAIGIQWRCTARYDNLDRPTLNMMKKANCTGLYIGLESGSDRVLKAVSKKITVDKIIQVSKMVYKSRIPTVTSVLLGLPIENKEDLKDTVRLMKKVKTEIFDVNCYVPLPGTPLYDSMPEEDRQNIDWGKVAYKSTFSKSFSREISQKDFAKYKAKAYHIANNVRQKTILRFGTRMILRAMAGKFRRKKTRPAAPARSPTLTTDTNPGLAEP